MTSHPSPPILLTVSSPSSRRDNRLTRHGGCTVQISRTCTHNARNIWKIHIHTRTQTQTAKRERERETPFLLSQSIASSGATSGEEISPIPPPHFFRSSESHFKSKYDSSVLTCHERERERVEENCIK